jgi:hypothetical protein
MALLFSLRSEIAPLAQNQRYLLSEGMNILYALQAIIVDCLCFFAAAKTFVLSLST